MTFKKGDKVVWSSGLKGEFETYLSQPDENGFDSVVSYPNESGGGFLFYTARSHTLQLEKPPEFEVGKTYRLRGGSATFTVMATRDGLALCWLNYCVGSPGSGLLHQQYRNDYEEV
jgi:hypothetical protein